LRFRKRKHIALRAGTNRAQCLPENHRAKIQSFHQFIRKKSSEPGVTRDLGRYVLGNVANMDQTPLQFEFLSGKTYEPRGAKSVWLKSQGSGLEKRQATVQLTIHADGIPRTKPLLVFRGKGKRITELETRQYDHRVVVQFQKQAWVDSEVMLKWMRNQWKASGAEGPIHNNPTPRMLVLDVHRAQKTEPVKDLFKELHTTPVMVPPGCTSLVQPLDVVVNKPFKDYVADISNQHFQDHAEKWVNQKYTASERRILMTKWVGEAWSKVCSELKESIIRSFRKCGITVAIDGSQDDEININGLADYVVGSSVSVPSLDLIVEDEIGVPDDDDMGDSEDMDIDLNLMEEDDIAEYVVETG
jgi:DDE superfamily endonuclease